MVPFLRSNHKGQLFNASGTYANYGMYPITYAVNEWGSGDCWKLLKQDLKIKAEGIG